MAQLKTPFLIILPTAHPVSADWMIPWLPGRLLLNTGREAGPTPTHSGTMDPNHRYLRKF